MIACDIRKPHYLVVFLENMVFNFYINIMRHAYNILTYPNIPLILKVKA